MRVREVLGRGSFYPGFDSLWRYISKNVHEFTFKNYISIRKK